MSYLYWDAIRGQTGAVKLLRGALRSERVAHAYLFIGPPGVGRKMTASVFAAAMLCDADDVDARPCGACVECRAVAADVHPDLYRMRPVDDKILIEQVRTLQQRVSLRAVRGRYKVFIVEAIDIATQQAQNALLKLLEEPPGNAVFILITNEGAPPLQTIVSRCSPVRFGPLTRDEAAAILRERFDYGSAAELAAALGDGTVRVAARTTPEQLLERRRVALQLLDDVFSKPVSSAAVQTELWYKERDELPGLLDMMQVWLRDVLICQQVPAAAEQPGAWLVNFDRADELMHRAAQVDSSDVVAALDAIFVFRRRIAQNVGIRSALNVLFLDLAAAGRPAAS